MNPSKIAIVTGAGTGIGRAVTLALARHGWKVALAGRRREPLDAVAAEAPPARRASSPTDVARPASVKALFDGTGTRLAAASISCSTTPASARRRSRSRT